MALFKKTPKEETKEYKNQSESKENSSIENVNAQPHGREQEQTPIQTLIAQNSEAWYKAQTVELPLGIIGRLDNLIQVMKEIQAENKNDANSK